MNSPNLTQLRKDIYDYLTTALSQVADVSTQHPVTNDRLGKGKVVVQIVRDANLGKYVSAGIGLIEIQMTVYHVQELALTAPNKLRDILENALENYPATGTFDKIRETFPMFIKDINYFMMSQIWRFDVNVDN